MIRMTLKRTVAMLFVLLLVTVFTFWIFTSLSPDPAVQICGKNCTPEKLEQIQLNLGLNEPFLAQLFTFLSGLLFGRTFSMAGADIICSAPCLGYSFQTSQVVTEMLAQRFPVSLTIALGAAVLWVIIGVGAGVVSAVNEGKLTDRILAGLTLGAMSNPIYVTALVLQYVFVVALGWLPFPNAARFSDGPGVWFGSYILPWIALSLLYAATYTRLTRVNVIETLQENFVRTARAKGLTASLIWRRHALRPSLTPIVTMLGMDFAALLGGALITETVFGMNGIGKLTADSIVKNDQPVIMAVTLLCAVFVIVGNLVVDLVYASIDPRVRTGSAA